MIIPLLILAVACIGFFVCMRRFDPFFAMSEAHSKKIIAKASKPEECLRVIPVVERLRLHGGTKDVGHDNCPGCLECIPIARVKEWRAVSISVVDTPVDPNCKISDGDYLGMIFECVSERAAQKFTEWRHSRKMNVSAPIIVKNPEIWDALLRVIASEEMVFRCGKCHLLIEGTRNFAMHENLCEGGRHK